MIRISSSLLLLTILFLAACENKPGETTDANVKDSLQSDSAVVVTDTTNASAPALSEKASMVTGSWRLTELETPDMKLSGELIDIRFNFNKDMTFEYSENGKKDTGTWKLNDQENQVMLTYKNDVKSDLDIKDLKEDKMTLSGKEHGMYRTYVLARAK